MKLTFLQSTYSATGSCFYLEACGKNILIDCGEQFLTGDARYEIGNGESIDDLPINKKIDFVLLTHAHKDHVNLLSSFIKNNPDLKIYATEATKELCIVQKVKDFNKVETMAYGENKELFCDSPNNKIKARFHRAGHLLGAASIEMQITENGKTKTIVFSGDLGNDKLPLLKKDSIEGIKADYLVVEGTRGNELDDNYDICANLEEIIEGAFNRDENVVIPVSAIGLTQEFLYFIKKIKEANEDNDAVRNAEVYVVNDKITDVYKKFITDINNNDVFNPKYLSQSPIMVRNPSIIIENTDKTTTKYLNSTTISLNVPTEGDNNAGQIPAETITINCTSHADQQGLIKWIEQFSKSHPKTVFVCHGRKAPKDKLIACLKGKNISAVSPYYASEFDLISGKFTNVPENKKINILEYITTIRPYAFWECNELEEITIPGNVKEIGLSAFWRCSSLKNITIPNSVTKIGIWAFSDCSSLTEITLPDSVKEIGDKVFENCTNLKVVHMSQTLFDKYKTANKFNSNNMFKGCTNPDEITIHIKGEKKDENYKLSELSGRYIPYVFKKSQSTKQNTSKYVPLVRGK